jgi:hypothetical protein
MRIADNTYEPSQRRPAITKRVSWLATFGGVCGRSSRRDDDDDHAAGYHPPKVWVVPLVNNQPNIANLRRRSGCGWRMTTRTPRGWLADQKQPKAPSR